MFCSEAFGPGIQVDALDMHHPPKHRVDQVYNLTATALLDGRAPTAVQCAHPQNKICKGMTVHPGTSSINQSINEGPTPEPMRPKSANVPLPDTTGHPQKSSGGTRGTCVLVGYT